MAIVNGYIKNTSGQPIPFASIEILDGYFVPTGEGTSANSNGYFFLNVDPNNEPYSIYATSVGYKPLGIKISSWVNGAIITLQINPLELPPVVVTSGSQSQWKALLLLLPLLLVLNKKKRGKVSGIKQTFNGLPMWAKGIIAVGGGFVAYTTVKRLLDVNKEKQEPANAGSEVNNQAQQGVYPTHTDAQFEAYSNAIVAAIWDCGTDENAIYNVMRAMNNEADIYKLIQVYGVRRYKGCFENPFGLIERSLSGAMSSELSGSEKTKVNDILRAKGIQFQFV